MSSPHHGSDSFDSNSRKRVGKACDRCRLKKSKCDGSSPCTRCKLDNTICVFGERKKSQDRVYPKGYVEMIEQQQVSITNGLRKMYNILLEHDLWDGSKLPEFEGHPLTHDILERLDVLHSNNGDAPLKFEDDFEEMQERLLKQNGPSARQRKISSDSVSSSRDEFVKAESSERSIRRSLESSCSTPTSGTFSIASSSSRKRSPETPASDTMSPAPQPKKIRASLTQTPPMSMSYASPEPLFDFPNYNMLTVPNPMDSASYLLPSSAYGFPDASMQKFAMSEPMFSPTQPFFDPTSTFLPTMPPEVDLNQYTGFAFS